MASIKRIILTRKQLNEVLKEENTTTVQLNTTGNTITSLTNAVTQNQPEINNAGKYGDVDLHISNQKLVGSNDSVPTQHVEVEKGQNVNQAIQQQVNPTVLSDGGDVEVSGDGISEYKSFSKRQIEEARLKKINEGYKITKRKLREHWEEKPNDDVNQWNEEFKTFIVSWMAELTAPKKGKVGGNMLIKAVDKKEAEKKFKKRLFANGYNGEPVSFMLVDLKIEEADNVNEGKIKINPENKGKFNATKKRTGKSTEELTHSKNTLTRKRANFAKMAKRNWKPLEK